MDLQSVLSPELKTTAASSIVAAHQQVHLGSRPRILLLPSSTGYDYNRFKEEWPEAKFWAVEKDQDTWATIFATGRYEKVFRGDVLYANLRGQKFDIVYLDLMSTFSESIAEGICFFLEQENVEGRRRPVFSQTGGTLALTLIQKPARNSNPVLRDAINMTPEHYARSIGRHLSLYNDVDLHFEFQSVLSYRNRATFCTCIYDVLS